MRLVYILLSPTFGMHQYTAHLANQMLGSGDISLITTRHYPSDRYLPGVNIVCPIDTSDSGLSTESMKLNQLLAVKAKVEELQPDIVHITGPHLWNTYLVRWLKRRKIPVIHTIHDPDPHPGAGYGRLLNIWNELIYRSADRVLVHGELYRKRLLDKGMAGSSVSYIPLLHLFLGAESQVSARLAVKEVRYESSILYFGRVRAYKGVEVLLEAYQAFRSRFQGESEPPMLVIAGSGDLRDGWSARLPSGVQWRNHFVDDGEAIDLFRRCSLVVLPYLEASQSAIIASAYYFYKPVVVTRVGALPEYVDEGNTGLVVEPGDPQALALALSAFYDKPSYHRTMGMAGRKWYDIRRVQEKNDLKKLYLDCGRSEPGKSFQV